MCTLKWNRSKPNPINHPLQLSQHVSSVWAGSEVHTLHYKTDHRYYSSSCMYFTLISMDIPTHLKHLLGL